MTIEVSLERPIFLQNNGRVQFPISVKAKNIGRMPAESLHLGVYSKGYSEPGKSLANFVQENIRDGAQFRTTILLPGESYTQVWPKVPKYDPPKDGEAFKVTIVNFYVGVFYKTSIIKGDRITATSYISAFSVEPSENGHVLRESVVGFDRDEGIVT